MTSVALDRGGGQRGKGGLIWDWQVKSQFEPDEKRFLDSHHPGSFESQQKEAGVVAQALSPQYLGGGGRRSSVR